MLTSGKIAKDAGAQPAGPTSARRPAASVARALFRLEKALQKHLDGDAGYTEANMRGEYRPPRLLRSKI